LFPGEAISVRVSFEAITATDLTTNTAIVEGSIDEHGNTIIEAVIESESVAIRVPTAIVLEYFKATSVEGGILLEWKTILEIDNWGFNLYRGLAPDFSTAERINDELIPGQGRGRASGAYYSYFDSGVEPGVEYYYWLEDVEIGGKTTQHGPVMVLGVPYRIYLPLIFKR
jgi:hypothetical protein